MGAATLLEHGQRPTDATLGLEVAQHQDRRSRPAGQFPRYAAPTNARYCRLRPAQGSIMATDDHHPRSSPENEEIGDFSLVASACIKPEHFTLNQRGQGSNPWAASKQMFSSLIFWRGCQKVLTLPEWEPSCFGATFYQLAGVARVGTRAAGVPRSTTDRRNHLPASDHCGLVRSFATRRVTVELPREPAAGSTNQEDATPVRRSQRADQGCAAAAGAASVLKRMPWVIGS